MLSILKRGPSIAVDYYIKAKGLGDVSGKEGERGGRKFGFMLALRTMDH